MKNEKCNENKQKGHGITLQRIPQYLETSDPWHYFCLALLFLQAHAGYTPLPAFNII